MPEDNRITLFAEVLLPLPVPGTFTYRVPYALNEAIHVGQRVAVQFGKTKIMSGLVVGLSEKVPTVEVKYLIDLLDSDPIVNPMQTFPPRDIPRSPSTVRAQSAPDARSHEDGCLETEVHRS